MFYPFGQKPLIIISEPPYYEFFAGIHQPLCPYNPFSTFQIPTDSLQKKALLCICTRIDAEGLKLLEQINREVNSENAAFATNDPLSTEPQNSATTDDNTPQVEIALTENSPESKQAGKPNSEEGNWVTRRPRPNTRAPHNKTAPGKGARVVTKILSRAALPVTGHYPYSGSFCSWPNSPNAHLDVRWNPQKKANKIYAKPAKANKG